MYDNYVNCAVIRFRVILIFVHLFSILNKLFDHFTGRTLQMVDLMLWPWFERFLIMAKINPQMVSLEDFPLLRQWTGVMSESPAVVKCRLPLEQFLGFAKSAKMGAPNYDIGLEQDS